MAVPDPNQQAQEPAVDVAALTQAAGGHADACHASDAPTAAQKALDSAALTTYWAETLGDALTDGTLDADQHLPHSRPRTDSGVTTIRDLDLLPVATVRRSQSGVASAPPAHRHAPSAAVVTGGSFDIRHMLGQGGMGIVYCAHQGSLDREVALKTLKPEAALHGGRDRFVAEARVTGALDHPNIVPVHELGRTEDGEVFLAMKMVRGAAWSALLGPKATELAPNASAWTTARHLQVLLDVCNAVAFAHSKGVIHRDLKPENVMVGDYGEVLVMDWGIAIDVRQPPPADLRAPHVSMVKGPAGTPCYMAPELATGDAAAMGVRTDIYLLGAILHEILTGRPPHTGKGVLEVLLAAARSEPPQFADSVPTCLQAICRKAMAAQPSDRYAQVAQLREELVQYQQHAQSMRLGDEAQAIAMRLLTAGQVPAEVRYGVFGDALARFDQSLGLWAGNDAARHQRAVMRLVFAKEALERSDVGLAQSQLQALQSDSSVDRGQLAALQLQATRHQGGQRGRWISASVALGVGVLLTTVGLHFERAGAQQAAARQHRSTVASHLRNGWAALAADDPVAAAPPLHQVRNLPLDDVPEGVERVGLLELGYATVLWRDGRLADLFDVACAASVNHGEQRAQASAVSPPASTAGQRRSGPGRRRQQCLVLAERLTSGPPAKRIQAAEQIQAQWRAVAQPNGQLTALYALAPLALAKSATAVDFSVAGVPWPVQAGQLPAGATLTREGSGTWRAVAPRPEAQSEPNTLWRRDFFGGESDGGGQSRPIAVATGGVLLCERHAILHLDGRSGRVLHRLVVDGRIVTCAPDAAGSGNLVVLVSSHDGLGAARLLQLGSKASPKLANGAQLAELGRLAQRAKALVEAIRPATAAVIDTHLARELALDPLDAYLWAARLDNAHGTAAQRADWAQQVVHGATLLPPWSAVLLGLRLERAHLVSHADSIYAAAAADFIARGGNADLYVGAVASPASPLRKLAAERVAAGDGARAHHLFAIGRQFSTFIEGDHVLYRRFVHWRDAATQVYPATPSRDQLQQRIADSRHAAGAFMLPTWLPAALDQAIFGMLFLTLLLIAVLVGQWLHVRPTQHSDLQALGFAKASEQWLAWLSHPLERLRLSTFCYIGRPARAMFAVLGLVVLTCLGSAAATTAKLQEVLAYGIHLGNGFAHEDATRRDLAALPVERRQRASYLHLAAEGAWLGAAAGPTGDDQRAQAFTSLQAALALDGHDALVLNNLAVVAEARGHAPVARQHYAQAAAQANGTAGRWNLARLDRNVAALSPAALSRATLNQATLSHWALSQAAAALPHRDALVVAAQGDQPLWARSSISDLAATLLVPDGFAETIAAAISDSVRGNSLAVLQSVLQIAADDDVLGYFVQAVGVVGVDVALSAVLVGLLWLPARVRPVRPPPTPAQPSRWLRAVAWLRRAVFWIVPGTGDALGDRPARGIAVATLYILLFGAAGTLHGEGAIAAATVVHQFDLFPGIPMDSADTGLREWGTAAQVAVTAMLLLHWLGWWRRRSAAIAPPTLAQSSANSVP